MKIEKLNSNPNLQAIKLASNGIKHESKIKKVKKSKMKCNRRFSEWTLAFDEKYINRNRSSFG